MSKQTFTPSSVQDKKQLPVVRETDPPEQEAVKKSGLPEGVSVTTLGELGMKLPIGVRDQDGNLNKSFSTRPFKTRDEKILGKLKKNHMSMAEYVSLVVAHLCSSIGGIELNQDEEVELRASRLSQLYMGDIFYVYCWLRHEAMGDKLSLRFGCPTCQKVLPFQGDLKSVEVKKAENIEALRWEYELQDPITVRGEKVTKFQMSSPKWMTAIGAKGKEGDAKASAVRGSVIALNDSVDAFTLMESEVDELSKRDLETVCAEIDERFFGPNMAIEGKCGPEVCPSGGGVEFRAAINWDYDSFFSGSSK